MAKKNAKRNYPCLAPGCERAFNNPQTRKIHLVSHINEEQLLALLSGDSKKGDATMAKNDEVKEPDLAKAIGNIGSKLDDQGRKLDDVCARFPWLCETVEKLEKGATHRVEAGTEEWRKARGADLDHVLFSECPDCTPVRDEVLQARGRRLAEVEPESKGSEAKEPATSLGYRAGFKWDPDRKLYIEQESK